MDHGRLHSTSTLQRFTLFENTHIFLLIGGDHIRQKYRILTIDRTLQDHLSVSEDPTEYLVFNRFLLCRYSLALCTFRISELEKKWAKEGDVLERKGRFAAMIGCVRFFSTWYVILVQEAVPVGIIGGHYIYKIEEQVILPINLKMSQAKWAGLEERYKQLFCSVSLKNEFYFSYSYDLTNTLQHHVTQSPLRPHAKVMQGMPKFNDMFLWNFYHMQEFSSRMPRGDAAKWIVPIIHGSFCQQSFVLNGRILRLSLISRRSRHFAGPRYLKRGMDTQGHVANEIETEQILQVQSTWMQGYGIFSSHVVLRGSIPLFWTQSNPLSPVPDFIMRLGDPEVEFEGAKSHFLDLFARYGSSIHVISLIRISKHKETTLGAEFSRLIDRVTGWLQKNELGWWQSKASGFFTTQPVNEQLRRKFLAAWEESTEGIEVCESGLDEEVGQTLEYVFQKFGFPKWSTDIFEQNNVNSKSGSSSNNSGIGKRPKFCVLKYLEYDLLDAIKRHSNVVRDITNLSEEFLDAVSHLIFVPLHGKLAGPNTPFFLQQAIHKRQHGIIRVNCVDCLDRTNVTQFALLKASLQRQITEIFGWDEYYEQPANRGPLLGSHSNELQDSVLGRRYIPLENLPEILEAFQIMFTLQGDRIANQYGGSGAMHKELIVESDEVSEVALDQRQKKSMPSSGGFAINALASVQRYYNNNFSDLEKQQGLNVFLGNYIPSPNEVAIWDQDKSKVHERVDEKFHALCIPSPKAATMTAEVTLPLRLNLQDCSCHEGTDAYAPCVSFPLTLAKPLTPNLLTSLYFGSLSLSGASQGLVPVFPDWKMFQHRMEANFSNEKLVLMRSKSSIQAKSSHNFLSSEIEDYFSLADRSLEQQQKIFETKERKNDQVIVLAVAQDCFLERKESSSVPTSHLQMVAEKQPWISKFPWFYSSFQLYMSEVYDSELTSLKEFLAYQFNQFTPTRFVSHLSVVKSPGFKNYTPNLVDIQLKNENVSKRLKEIPSQMRCFLATSEEKKALIHGLDTLKLNCELPPEFLSRANKIETLLDDLPKRMPRLKTRKFPTIPQGSIAFEHWKPHRESILIEKSSRSTIFDSLSKSVASINFSDLRIDAAKAFTPRLVAEVRNQESERETNSQCLEKRIRSKSIEKMRNESSPFLFDKEFDQNVLSGLILKKSSANSFKFLLEQKRCEEQFLLKAKLGSTVPYSLFFALESSDQPFDSDIVGKTSLQTFASVLNGACFLFPSALASQIFAQCSNPLVPACYFEYCKKGLFRHLEFGLLEQKKLAPAEANQNTSPRDPEVKKDVSKRCKIRNAVNLQESKKHVYISFRDGASPVVASCIVQENSVTDFPKISLDDSFVPVPCESISPAADILQEGSTGNFDTLDSESLWNAYFEDQFPMEILDCNDSRDANSSINFILDSYESGSNYRVVEDSLIQSLFHRCLILECTIENAVNSSDLITQCINNFPLLPIPQSLTLLTSKTENVHIFRDKKMSIGSSFECNENILSAVNSSTSLTPEDVFGRRRSVSIVDETRENLVKGKEKSQGIFSSFMGLFGK